MQIQAGPGGLKVICDDPYVYHVNFIYSTVPEQIQIRITVRQLYLITIL